MYTVSVYFHILLPVIFTFPIPHFLTVDGLREEELIRSGNREQKKKIPSIGSGSGEVDDVTEALAALPTVVYRKPTTTGRGPTNIVCQFPRSQPYMHLSITTVPALIIRNVS